MSLGLRERFKYLAWAATHRTDNRCPGCGSPETAQLRRKYAVTALRECSGCGLRFRSPKGNAKQSEALYQQAYTQGFMTDCPTDEQLARLTMNGFRGTEMDFSSYIDLLRSVGLKSGDSILDFGCSWGYGSWQLSRAGFRVYSCEVSKPRAEYAKTKLGCELSSAAELPRKVKCLFSAHVIEHLDAPDLIWETARSVLSPDGFIACFCPNGNPELESTYGLHRYDQLWGKVHPLLITPRFLETTSSRHGFTARLQTSPYGLVRDLHGGELCMIAYSS